jgi:fibronectin-binding autotransporter adhesin
LITNNGTFNASTGTVEMKGTNTQLIGANTFAGNTIMNLTINNSAGVILQGPLSVTGIVKAANGNLTSGGNLTLVSTASQTALIDGAGTGDVLGDVTMQRYLSTSIGYKYVSSPFSNTTVAAFTPFLPASSAIPSFYSYDEDNHRDSSGVALYQSGWVAYSSGSLFPMSGYAANFGSALSAKTISITGIVNNGSKSVTLYNHDRKYTKGFNLVGNPYPSPIDWDAASGWTKTNIDNALYYFNASTSDQYEGSYSTYINGISSDGSATNIIPSMQGFFVHVSDGASPVTGTLALKNSVRVTDMTHPFIKSSEINSIPLIRLSAGFSNDTASRDPMVIYFDDKASDKFDSKLDALKLMNTAEKAPNFYALSADAHKLSINAIPYPDSMYVVPLGLKMVQAGLISISANSIQNMPSDFYIYLLDNKTGIYTDLLQSAGLKLNINAGTEENRFSLVFSKRKLSDIQGSDGAFNVYSSDGKLIVSLSGSVNEKGNLVITNMIGQELWSQQIIGTGVHEFYPRVKDGVYVVSFYTGRNIYSKKILIINK